MFRAALLMFALSGCNLLAVDIEIPEACVTFLDQEVPGVLPGQAYTKTFVAEEFKLPDGFVQLDAVVTEARATLTLTRGASDFTFLDGVTLEVSDSAGALPPTMLIACEAGACMSSSATTEIHAQIPENLTDYARGEAPRFTVTMTGNLPSHAWYTDVEVCISGRASVKI
jgi:hypothetical protein